ncbi:MAG: anti-sigma factor [Gordonia sp. (in: high G+C Gram-positive bacteria)]
MGEPRGSRTRRWTAPAGPSIAANPDYRPRGFASTDHLAADAVVAYVDGVLSPQAGARADAHLRVCDHCAAEVANQAKARSLLRSSMQIAVPPSLLGQLSQIPTREIDLRDVNRRGR